MIVRGNKEVIFPRGKGLDALNEKARDSKKRLSKKIQPELDAEDDLFKVHKRKLENEEELNNAKKKKTKRMMIEEEQVRIIIDNMSLQKLPEGITILGCVQAILDYEIKLSIPGGIIVVVPVTNISTPYSHLIEKFAEDPATVTEKLLKPDSLFKIGQHLPVKIIEKRNSQNSHKVQVLGSLNPRVIYSNVIPSTFFNISSVKIVAAVVSQEDHGYIMDVGSSFVNAFLSNENAEPFIKNLSKRDRLMTGELVTCTVETITNGRNIKLTTSPKTLNKSKFTSETEDVSLASLIPGMTVSVTVTNITNKGLDVSVIDEFPGFVHLHHLKSPWHLPTKNYQIGTKLVGSVLYVHPLTRLVAITLKPLLEQSIIKQLISIKLGTIFQKGQVVGFDDRRGYVLKLSQNVKAIVTKKYASVKQNNSDEPEQLTIGSEHNCKILQVNLMDSLVTATLRQSDIETSSYCIDELEVGVIVSGKVVMFNRAYVLIELGPRLRGIVPDVHFAETPMLNADKLFPLGKVVKCAVLRIDKTVFPPKLVLSCKKSFKSKKNSILKDFESATKGSHSEGVIIDIKTKGLLVEFFNGVKGFVPERYMSAYSIQSPEEVFKRGQMIRCTVVKQIVSEHKLILSLITKSQYVLKEKEKSNLKTTSIERNKTGNIEEQKNVKNISSENESKSQKTSSNKNRKSKMQDVDCKNLRNLTKTLNGNVESNVAKKEKEDSLHQKQRNKKKLTQQNKLTNSDQPITSNKQIENSCLPEIVGFTWEVDARPNLTKLELPNESSSEESDNDEDETTKRKSRKERNEEVRQREELLRKREEYLMDTERCPETVDDYERAALASPNSSLVWLRYMAFHLEQAEIDKARAVGNRALKTISFREEQEKVNIWVALLNLENLYGTPSTLEETFQQTLQTNEPFTIYQHLAKIYTKSDKNDQAEILYQKMLKKFKSNKQIWINFGEFYLTTNRADEARKLMQQSFASLPSSDHVEVISKFALMEFKFGDYERGKSLFEKILTSYPKRVDIWSVYIDALIKYSSLESEENRTAVREVLEKAISIKLTPKRMKLLFKKYLDFETQFGDEDRIERIKDKAMEYVEGQF